jgi:carbon monoxide dehydrogenase subunit G
MKLEGNYKFGADQAQVWKAFTDPRSLERAIPGCEHLKEYEPNKFDALLRIGIPAVKGTYTGKFEIVDANPPQQCRLVGEGSGTPGFVKCETIIRLTTEEGSTVVNYSGDLQIGGLISGIGQRMIGGIAKMLLNQFFKRMSKVLKGESTMLDENEHRAESAIEDRRV